MTALTKRTLIASWKCFNCPTEADVALFDMGARGFRFQHGENPEHSMVTTGALGVPADRGWTEYHTWRDAIHERAA